MKKDGDIYKSGKMWVLIGIVVLVIPNLLLNPQNLKVFTTELCTQLGLAFICLGIVAIILQFKDWKLYFQERLKEIVTQKSYLESLSEEELLSLQIDTLKAKYKDTDIDREGSFLHYFQKKIQSYISSPYREHVTCSLLIEENKENDECFKVYDNLTYTCRSIGEDIQEDVRWLYEHNEFEEVYEVEIIFSCSKNKTKKCDEFCKSNKDCQNGKIKLNKKILDEEYLIKTERQKGYQVKLKDILWPSDHLQIELITSYSINKRKFFTWAMTHPSKDVSFTIVFPKGYEINHFVGGIEPSEYSSNTNGNMFTFKHEGWFLPRTGIAYNFVKIRHDEK